MGVWNRGNTARRGGTKLRRRGGGAAERMQGADMAAGEQAGEGEEDTQGEANYAALNTVNVVEPQMEPQIEPQIEPHLPVTDEERDRRRKGKEICMEWAQRANDGYNEPDQVLSGSGSCDPLLVGGGLEKQQVEEGSEDADSKAGPMTGPVSNMGSNKDKPIMISEGSQQDEDLGGEGKLFVKNETEVGKEKEGGDKNPTVMKKGGAVGTEEKRGLPQGSRGTAGSVPPGYTRLPRSQLGVSSPFGKLQRAGFKFLKRSASSSGSTGAKNGPPAPLSKKTRPIAGMESKDIVEVASNVGVAETLTEEQIDRLKNLEKDRASS